jgi:hypothetical protein
MSEWCDIETAPMDVPILAYNFVTGPYRTRFDGGEWPMTDWYKGEPERPGVWYPRPTHWMPLPKPPAP